MSHWYFILKRWRAKKMSVVNVLRFPFMKMLHPIFLRFRIDPKVLLEIFFYLGPCEKQQSFSRVLLREIPWTVSLLNNCRKPCFPGCPADLAQKAGKVIHMLAESMRTFDWMLPEDRENTIREWTKLFGSVSAIVPCCSCKDPVSIYFGFLLQDEPIHLYCYPNQETYFRQDFFLESGQRI